MRYRKKPVVIEAVQWTGDNWKPLYDFCKPPGASSVLTGPHPNERVSIETLEGTMFADLGDWIIRGVAGEFYPCKPDIFHATYEPVDYDWALTEAQMTDAKARIDRGLGVTE